jgi:hypothetical protein
MNDLRGTGLQDTDFLTALLKQWHTSLGAILLDNPARYELALRYDSSAFTNTQREPSNAISVAKNPKASSHQF